MNTVVLVTEIAFWQNTYGSHSRMQGLVRFLSKENRLVVFFLRTVDDKVLKGFQELGLPRSEIVSYKDYSGRAVPIEKRVGRVPFFKPTAVDDYTSSLAAYLGEHPAEAVIFEYIRLAYLADACPPGVARILDAHDVMSERTISMRRAGLKASIEMDAAAERLIMVQLDRVLSISRRDDAFLRDTFGLENNIYVPCSVPKVHTHKVGPNGKRLLFIGAESEPNIVGLRWFLDHVWPLLSPDGFTLDVLGAVGKHFTEPLPGLNIVGQSDDVEPYYSAADIAINPVFVGGGLKIKCIDALSYGLPCVTTVEGAAGLHGAIGSGLVVAQNRLDFARAIRHFAKAPADRQIVAALGPRFIEREFLESVAYRGLEDYLSTLKRPARPRHDPQI